MSRDRVRSDSPSLGGVTVRARKPDGSREVAAQIRAYHADLPPAARRVLKALQTEVRAAAPAALPAFSYRVPAYAMDGRMLVWCAGWKEHVAIYPVTKAMQRAGGAALARYRHAKGTLRFALDAPLPRALIRRIVKARVAELARS